MRPTDPFYHRYIPKSHDAMVSHPYWGPSTSSVDWCEQNYAHTRYVAEMWNTLSSIPLIFVCLYGGYQTAYHRSSFVGLYNSACWTIHTLHALESRKPCAAFLFRISWTTKLVNILFAKNIWRAMWHPPYCLNKHFLLFLFPWATVLISQNSEGGNHREEVFVQGIEEIAIGMRCDIWYICLKLHLCVQVCTSAINIVLNGDSGCATSH